MKALLFGFALLMTSIGLFTYTQPQLASAQSSLACDGLSPSVDGGDCSSDEDVDPNLNKTIASVLNILSVVAGAIAVVMIMIAGVKFITSQGDSGKVASARSTIIYALVGIVIVALSQVIVFFFIDSATSSPPPASNQSTPI